LTLELEIPDDAPNMQDAEQAIMDEYTGRCPSWYQAARAALHPEENDGE
jgi:hypothetical protein